jgi:hypothetical protein
MVEKPSGNFIQLLKHGPFIVDLAGYKMVIFHSYVDVYQRVNGGLDQNHKSMAISGT